MFAGNYFILARCLLRQEGDASRRLTIINVSEILKINPVNGLFEWATPANRFWPSFTDRCDPNTIYFGPSQWGQVLSAVCGDRPAQFDYPDNYITNQNGNLEYDLVPGLGQVSPPPQN
jgi:hypothetical protein